VPFDFGFEQSVESALLQQVITQFRCGRTRSYVKGSGELSPRAPVPASEILGGLAEAMQILDVELSPGTMSASATKNNWSLQAPDMQPKKLRPPP